MSPFAVVITRTIRVNPFSANGPAPPRFHLFKFDASHFGFRFLRRANGLLFDASFPFTLSTTTDEQEHILFMSPEWLVIR